MVCKPEAPDNCDTVMHLLRLKGLEDAARWLTTPHADLGGLTPENALACGRSDDVRQLVLAGLEEERLAC